MSTHPINTSFQYTLLTHTHPPTPEGCVRDQPRVGHPPVITSYHPSCQHILSPLLSTRPINTPSQHTRSTHPLNTPPLYTTSTHPLNTSFQRTFLTTILPQLSQLYSLLKSNQITVFVVGHESLSHQRGYDHGRLCAPLSTTRSHL